MEKRNASVDLVRIMAMLLVCVLHVARYSGFRSISWDISFAGRLTSDVCIICAIVAVNIYAMLSGYLCINKSWHLKRFVSLWLLVVFYSLLLYIAGIMDSSFSFSCCGILKSLNPFSSDYWYFAAYAGLYVLQPYINRGLNNLSRQDFQTLLMICFISFCVLGHWRSNLLVSYGFNFAWLIIMYAVGAYCKLYPITIKSRIIIGIYIIILFVSFLIKQFNNESWYWRSYAFVNCAVSSICVLILLLRLKISSRTITLFLAWLAPSSFSVYLIHMHPYMKHLMQVVFPEAAIATGYAWWFVPLVSVVLYGVCSVVDRVRIMLFNKLRVDKLAAIITDALPESVKKLDSKIHS